MTRRLDRTTPMAIGAGLVAVVLSMVLDGSSPAALFKPAPLLLVFGGTFAASAAGYMRADVKATRDVVKSALGVPEPDPDADIERIAELAETARRDGLLALERDSADIDDPFFRRGIQMAVDGIDSEQIETILDAEIAAAEEHHRVGAKFFQDMAGFSPTLGIIGTVVGLIHVLQDLSSPGTIGPAISSAFIATLWGVLSANLLWLPLANKLKRSSQLEIRRMRIILDGILAVQAGASPRMVRVQLQSHLSPAAALEERAA